jgi:hypothetical protein
MSSSSKTLIQYNTGSAWGNGVIIDSGGNVAIGATTTNVKFTVGGPAVFTNTVTFTSNAAAGTADAAFHDNSAPDLGRPTAASPFAETKRVTQGDMKITPKYWILISAPLQSKEVYRCIEYDPKISNLQHGI